RRSPARSPNAAAGADAGAGGPDRAGGPGAGREAGAGRADATAAAAPPGRPRVPGAAHPGQPRTGEPHGPAAGAAERAGPRRAGVYAAVSDEAVRATWAERQANPRSRSAKLRWARKP